MIIPVTNTGSPWSMAILFLCCSWAATTVQAATVEHGYVEQWGSARARWPIPMGSVTNPLIDMDTSHTSTNESSFSVFARADGTVVASGVNYFGQCNVPAGLADVVAVSCAEATAYALRSNGTVVGWGQFGFNVPYGLQDVQAISAGRLHMLALKNDGSVVAWGNNSTGATAVPAALSGVVAVAGGNGFSVALKNDGTVVVWGSNGSLNPFPAPPVDLDDVVAIAAGGFHALALKQDGTVVAWGSNTSQQLEVPAGLTDVVSIAAGTNYTVAVKSDGTATGWGRGGVGWLYPVGQTGITRVVAGGGTSLFQLQDGGVIEHEYAPKMLMTTSGPDNVAQLSTDGGYPWILTGDGAPFNLRNGAGDGTGSFLDYSAYNLSTLLLNSDRTVSHSNASMPFAISSGKSVKVGGDHAMVLKMDGSVVAWGVGGSGQVTLPGGFTGVSAISAGGHHILGLASGSVVAFGSNIYGQCDIPPDLSGVTAISAGWDHNLALKADGTVVGWGRNDYGQSTVPTDLGPVLAIAAGSYHSLALKTDGTVASWGSSGAGPVPTGLRRVRAIAAGNQYSFAVVDAGLAPIAPSDGNGAPNAIIHNSPVGTPVGVTAQSSDPDGDPLRFSLRDSAGGRFAIDSSSGVVTSRIDLSGATPGAYSISVMVDDGTLASTAAFSIVISTAGGPGPVDEGGGGSSGGGCGLGGGAATFTLLMMAGLGLLRICGHTQGFLTRRRR